MLLFLSFLLLRIYLLFTLPEVSDESIYIYKTYLMTEGWQIYRDFGDNRMPGFFLIFYPFIYLYKIIASPPYENIIYFGRFFAIIASFSSIVFIFEIGRYIRNDRTGFIAVALFLISPYALGLNSYVFLENFLTVFSLGGFYFFIRGIERNSERDLFVAGVAFGLAVSMKQMAVLLLPVAMSILLLTSVKPLTLQNIGKFLRRASIIASGGLLIGLVILVYFVFHGTYVEIFHAMSASVQQAQEWVNPSGEKILQDYIMPPLKANELITLIFGFCGLIFSLTLFLTQRDRHFGIKTLAIWFLCYTAVMYRFSYSYGLYYIPMLPPLVILSSYMIDYFLSSPSENYRKTFTILIFILLTADLYYLGAQYQDFTQNPMRKTTMLTPPLDQQISIAKYLYEHTNNTDKIFSIDPIYTLVSGREVVNHFTVSGAKLPTIEEYIAALNDERVKYAVVDDRARFHLKDKWPGVLEYIQQNFEMEKDFVVTAKKIEAREVVISLYRKR